MDGRFRQLFCNHGSGLRRDGSRLRHSLQYVVIKDYKLLLNQTTDVSLTVIQDLGNAPLSGWIIQGPLLMQSALSPFVGRLSDVLDRKWMATIPPIIAAVGAIVSARASNMETLIGGGILIGTTLSTIAIVQAIPSEVLPLKYRALANGK